MRQVFDPLARKTKRIPPAKIMQFVESGDVRDEYPDEFYDGDWHEKARRMQARRWRKLRYAHK